MIFHSRCTGILWCCKLCFYAYADELRLSKSNCCELLALHAHWETAQRSFLADCCKLKVVIMSLMRFQQQRNNRRYRPGAAVGPASMCQFATSDQSGRSLIFIQFTLPLSRTGESQTLTENSCTRLLNAYCGAHKGYVLVLWPHTS